MFDFKGMVDALFGRDSKQGVHDIKSATTWMEQLPRSDMQQALVEIVKALNGLNHNPKIKAKERFRTVLYLDEKAQPLERYLIAVYQGDEFIPEVQPRHVLPTLMSFWHEMANGYKVCIKQYSDSPSRALEPQLELVNLRALHYFAMQAKWAYCRYVEVDSRIWRNTHKLYLYATTEGYHQKPLTMFEGQKPTTIEAEYLRLLMLHLAIPEKRRAEQIELLDHWLPNWISLVQFENHIKPHRQLFAVNLDDARPPTKLRRNMVGDRYRYFQTDDLVAHVQKLVEKVKQGKFPPELGDLDSGRAPAIGQLLSEVALAWSRDGVNLARRHERTSTNKRVRVVYSLDDIIKLMHSPNLKMREPENEAPTSNQMKVQFVGPATITGDKDKNELFAPDHEEWIVENESVTGIGANYRAAFDDALEIGELIGAKAEKDTKFAVGIVRRLTKNREGKVNVGVELISQTPVLVELTPTDGSHPFFAVYAPESPNPQLGRFMVIPAAQYEAERELILSAQSKRYRIHLMPPLEALPDNVLANFKVLEKL
ncbi:hypothetical protein [Parachitinimonas caeni]|uniref:Uncharacterized protein n=1 Tax=Parachitinimonas caeni TaxID=3031301 RepID=A0ABT7E0Z2_9NEIS|nr:hypothetical protein [Parachitinimonas caeni]MDK2124587.1 hypothetical protein [Parachitinimonas caeni]